MSAQFALPPSIGGVSCFSMSRKVNIRSRTKNPPTQDTISTAASEQTLSHNHRQYYRQFCWQSNSFMEMSFDPKARGRKARTSRRQAIEVFNSTCCLTSLLTGFNAGRPTEPAGRQCYYDNRPWCRLIGDRQITGGLSDVTA